MELDRVAWQLGGLAEAGVRFAFERVEDAAGLAALASMRRVTDARRLLVARSLVGALHAAAPPVSRAAGASTAIAVLAAGRLGAAALRVPARMLAGLRR